MKAARLFPQALILPMFSKKYTGLHESCKPTTMGRISKITSNTDRSLHFTDPNGIIQVPRILQNHLRLLYATLFQVPVTVPRKTHFLFLLQLLSKCSQRQFCKQPECLKWGFIWVLEEFPVLVSNTSHILAAQMRTFEVDISSLVFSLPAPTCFCYQSPLNSDLSSIISLFGFVAFPTTAQINDQQYFRIAYYHIVFLRILR